MAGPFVEYLVGRSLLPSNTAEQSNKDCSEVLRANEGFVSFLKTQNILTGVVSILCDTPEDLTVIAKELEADSSGEFSDLVIYNPYHPHNSEPEVIDDFMVILESGTQRGNF